MEEEKHAENYVKELKLIGCKKVRNPEKYYVYVMRLNRVNGGVTIIFRRYSQFFDMHCAMIEKYKELVTSKPRWLPVLPKGGAFSRTNNAKAAAARTESLKEYLGAVMKLDAKYLGCEIMEEFFTITDDDLTFLKEEQTKESTDLKGETVGGPIALEEWEVLENFKAKDRKSISLYEGDVVEVVEKSDSGWWFVTCTSGTGWVPANFLKSLEGGEDLMQQCGKNEFYQCVCAYKATNKDEVTFNKGDIAKGILKHSDGWWKVAVNGKSGFGPAQYLIRVEGNLLMEDLEQNPPEISAEAVAKVEEMAPPNRSNNHKRISTRRARRSMRTARAPNAANIPTAVPEGDDMVVQEDYTANGVGQITLSKGDEVVVSNKANEEWWYVFCEGKQGWFPSAFLLDKSAIKEPEKFKVIANYTAESEQELAAKKGEIILITDQTSNPEWWFGVVGGREGWIPVSFLKKI